MNRIKKNGLISKSSFWLLLLIAFSGSQVRGADAVDGEVPPLQTGFLTLTGDQLNDGWLLLFDGRTLFGWKVVSQVGERPAGEPNPVLRAGRGSLTIETPVPLLLQTPLFWPRKADAGPELRIHSEGTGPRPAVTLRNGQGEKISVGEWTGDSVSFAPNRAGDVEQLAMEFSPGRYVLTELMIRYPPGMPANGDFWRAPDGLALDSTDGVTTLSGKGHLESVAPYGDFVARFQYQTVVSPESEKGKGCNSGFFFRCIEGSSLDGYECQINNCPPESDRGKFLGNDTGSLFRRSAARRLLARDNEWDHLTVMANGKTFRTWVNGIPTVVWQDERKPNNNPRQGLRLVPGTIQIQGHDDWTTIRFRDIFLVE